VSCFSDNQAERRGTDGLLSPKLSDKFDDRKNSFEQYPSNIKKTKSFLNNSGPDCDLHDYNTVRDNAYFNRFAIKYKEKLQKAFEEIDKKAPVGENSFKQDVLGYMDQNNDIRKQWENTNINNDTLKIKEGKNLSGS